ncbi:hypothetical protein [Rhizobium tropici]|uniref:Uncharacterized protein n=1 Tax=Rhizobium tropici TaxID=398 RepID=A0A329YHA2_RHITR|nr:hypothetical protein [Rhizobium tropici]RAX42378.1 hypothetical protein DQ393_05930 [Rhizobium tropici]
MEYDAQRAGIDAGAEDIPCPTRRGILGGLATFAAAASMRQIVVAHDQYDAVLRYLHSEFMDAAARLRRADAQTYNGLYRRMLALATALSVVPAAAPRSLRLKREVACWSLEDGCYTVVLPPDLTAALTGNCAT